MSESQAIKPLSTSELQGPTQDFSTYCEAEFERRRNSQEPFNEADYREAMALAVSKLKSLEDEGYA